MSRLTLFGVTAIVLVVSVIVIWWSFFGSSPAQPTIEQTSQSSPPAATQANSNLPVNVEHPKVKSIILEYTFTTSIQEIEGIPDRLRLHTDLQNEDIPPFIITPKTKIHVLTNGQKIEASSSALAPGQKIEVKVNYQLKKLIWRSISSITVLSQ